MRDPAGHPILAAGLDLAMAGLSPLRPRVFEGARGRVLEVGAGTGANFALYSPQVREVVAIEPDPYMRARAEARRAHAPVPIALLPHGAEALPFPDASFDEAVLTWVLCTIPDVDAAAREVYRVLKPGGIAHFIEHVAASCGVVHHAQRALDPLWTRLAGGCHLTRDASAILREAGFDVTVTRRYGPAWSPFPLLQGLATKVA